MHQVFCHLEISPSAFTKFWKMKRGGAGQFKYNLKRTTTVIKLTIEELFTTSTQIECILNFHPLSEVSSELEDYETLTPSHFLIGRPINALPERNLINEKEKLARPLAENASNSAIIMEKMVQFLCKPSTTKIRINL